MILSLKHLRRFLLTFVLLCTICEGGLVWLACFFPHGLSGRYYPNSQWQGPPCKKDVQDSDFYDVFCKAPLYSSDHFSAEWTGYFMASETMKYLFLTQAQEGLQLFIDETPVLEDEGNSPRSEHTGTIFLKKGLHPITIRYRQVGNNAGFTLTWKKDVEYYTRPRPLQGNVPYLPDLNRSWFQIYLAGQAILPLFSLCWLFLLFISASYLLYHEMFVHHLTRTCAYIVSIPGSIKVHFILSFLVLTTAMYCSTGTLAPYANTLNLDYPGYPTVDPHCQYLYNGDYGHFEALFLMLDGGHPDAWGFSVVSRRILYNILAYPFMKLLGHDAGGILTNLLLTWIVFTMSMVFLHRTVGTWGAKAGMWLLAVYPGITYYVGQPFLYALIVPGCLWLYMLLWRLEKSDTSLVVGLISLGMGILFTGYDFIVFFGFPAMIILLLRKKWFQIPLATAGILFPSVLWIGLLRFYYGGGLRNSNSQVYSTILKSYFLPKDYDKWVGLLHELPRITAANFFFSCFFFLPLLFLCVFVINFLVKQQRLTRSEIAVLGTIVFVFLFNNLAPAYEGWQMRGDWIPRLYQPMFVVLFMYIVRMYQRIMEKQGPIFVKWVVYAMFMMTLVGNGLVAFGPILSDPWYLSSHIYWRFYKHSGPESMNINLARYGRRPLGFCRRQP